MMNHAIKTAIIWALIYIIAKLSVMLLGYNHENYSIFIGFALNSMCLLLAIAIAIISNFNRHKHEGLSIVSDIKTGMKTGVIYAMLVATFLMSYYKWIDPEFLEINREMRLNYIESPEGQQNLTEQFEQNPELYEGSSKEDVLDKEEETTKNILTANKVFLMTLISIIVLSIVYSFAISAFNRIVLSKIGT